MAIACPPGVYNVTAGVDTAQIYNTQGRIRVIRHGAHQQAKTLSPTRRASSTA